MGFRIGQAKTARRAAVLSSLVFLGLAACTNTDEASGEAILESEPVNFRSSPEGAIPPEGISEVRFGMTQDEVLEILSPHHNVTHSADAAPEGPGSDYFIYSEGGERKWGEIFYDGKTVSGIRFGFKDYLVIE